MNLNEVVENKFKEIFFGEPPLMVCSPGRVNLIGEHTDYNMGFVLPAAIDKAIYFAVSPRCDDHCMIVSLDMNDVFEFDITALKKSEKGWPNYLVGVVDQLLRSGYAIKGFNCVFSGDIPIGAGLSSSAAIEAGLAFSLNHIFNLGIEKIELVKIAQKAENEFVGVQCGIMDQYINIFGVQDQVLKIDCRSLDYEYVPFEFKNISIVLFDTCVSHSLASSEYNQRRKECNEGVQIIRKKYPTINTLRDVTIEMLHELKHQMINVVFQRCKFVVEENERLLKGCTALKNGDLKTFGQLMYQAHDGLSKVYEVSCKELDYLVSLTMNHPKIYGARMMGGGFGGCTINLIETDAVEQIGNIVAVEYKLKFGIEMKMYVTTISKGTNIIATEEHAKI
jgi:galactokinase